MDDGGVDGDGGPAVCGDGVVNGDEECDGADVTHGACESCNIVCDTNYGDCNEDPTDGCESHFQSNPYACGGCETQCDPGQICVSGGCGPTLVTKLLVADGQGEVFDLVRDGQYVYWSGVDSSGPYLRRWPHAGGGSVEDVAPDDLEAELEMLAVDGSHVYAAACTDGGPVGLERSARELHRLPKGGGEPAVVHSTGGSIPCDAAIAVDDESLYFTAVFTPMLGVPRLELQSIPKGGGDATELFSSSLCLATELDVDASHVYLGLRQDAENRVITVPKTGGEATDLATTVRVPTDLLLLGDHVHYIDVDPEPDAWGTIHRVSKSGGAVELVVSGQMNPSDLAGDDGSIYWTNEGRVDDGADDGRVVGAAADGSDLQTVSAGEARPHLLVVTNDEVVWVNRNGGDAMVLTDGI
ncbi:MAG: hypothetical protein ACODAU_08680 [Myxococcota bacterium]